MCTECHGTGIVWWTFDYCDCREGKWKRTLPKFRRLTVRMLELSGYYVP